MKYLLFIVIFMSLPFHLTLWHLTSCIPARQCGVQHTELQLQPTNTDGHSYAALIKIWTSAAPTGHLILVPKD